MRSSREAAQGVRATPLRGMPEASRRRARRRAAPSGQPPWFLPAPSPPSSRPRRARRGMLRPNRSAASRGRGSSQGLRDGSEPAREPRQGTSGRGIPRRSVRRRAGPRARAPARGLRAAKQSCARHGRIHGPRRRTAAASLLTHVKGEPGSANASPQGLRPRRIVRARQAQRRSSFLRKRGASL